MFTFPLRFKSFTMPRPDLSRVPVFFHNYINQVPEDDLHESFRIQTPALFEFLETIPADKHNYRYAEEKWTIKEVIQHMIDAERIFAYRALRFARKDNTPLPGFDENEYTRHSKAGDRKWSDLIEEFKIVRKSSEYLYSSFDKEQLESEGVSNNNPNYVLGMAFITIGHTLHHKNILQERYL
jgi:uncharacterized damage-inducible protein DinB